MGGCQSYTQRVANQKAKKWMHGRLSIPDVGIDVALVQSMDQGVVDAQDSAGYFQWNSAWLIADHYNQGFDYIKQCTVGMKCYIDNGSETEIYECIETGYGHNTGYDITDNSYKSVLSHNPGKVVMYTCDNGWQNIAFVVWAKTK